MKNTLTLAATIFCISIFTSCKKENTTPDTPTPVPPVHDSVTLLTKLVYFDEGASNTDTSALVSFRFGTLHRVTSAMSYYFDNNVRKPIDEITFFYNGPDTLPLRSEEVESGTPYKTTVFYFYDNKQVLLKDSVIANRVSGNSQNIRVYTRKTDKIISTSMASDGSVYSTDTGYIAANGHVEKVVSTDAGIGRNVTSYYSYDDHPNPFQQLNIYAAFDPVPSYEYDILNFVQSKNNIVSQTTEDLISPGSTYNMIWAYTYNSVGLPEAVTDSDDNGASYYEKLVFVYEKL